MKKSLTRILGVTVVLAGIACASPAHAITVNYVVGGWTHQFPGPITPPANAPWGPAGYPGDTVGLEAYTGSLDLTPGTYTQKINTLLWTIDYTYGGTEANPAAWSDLEFAVSAARNMSIDGVGPVSLSQSGTLKCTWENDFLGLKEGPAVSFYVQGYRVVVTPLALVEVGGSNFAGGNPWVQPSRDVEARFEVTRAPDAGSTLILLGAAITGLGAFRRRLCA